MPIIYVCKACGHTLYTYELGQDYYGPRSYRQVAKKFYWRCPKCGHRLGFPEIEVRPRGTMATEGVVIPPLATFTGVNVPKDLLSRLKAYTEEKGVTISDVIQRALEEYLRARGWM